MKKRPNEDLRTAYSFCVRIDEEIGSLKASIKFFEAGIYSPAVLLQIASRKANRVNDLEISDEFKTAHPQFGMRLERKIAVLRTWTQEAARIAMGCESTEQCRQKAMDYARTAMRLHDRTSTAEAHELIWIASGGLPNEEEYEVFEDCERFMNIGR